MESNENRSRTISNVPQSGGNSSGVRHTPQGNRPLGARPPQDVARTPAVDPYDLLDEYDLPNDDELSDDDMSCDDNDINDDDLSEEDDDDTDDDDEHDDDNDDDDEPQYTAGEWAILEALENLDLRVGAIESTVEHHAQHDPKKPISAEIAAMIYIHSVFHVPISDFCASLSISRDSYYNVLKQGKDPTGSAEYRRLAQIVGFSAAPDEA